mgnify:CR=1 FL=1|jgi:hypothetical protein
MAIIQAIPTSFKAEILQGIHDGADTYKMALYTSAATLGAATTAYATTNEVTGTGYTAGGVTLSGFNVSTSGTTAILDFTTDPSWANATITARGALIYNSSKSNKAVYVLDFGADISSTNGTFTVTLPTPDAANGLIRLG